MIGRKRNSFWHLQRARRCVQSASLLFLIALPIFNMNECHWIVGNLYALSLGPLDIADPVMVMQTLLLSRTIAWSLILMAAIPILLALFFGRVFCSWMCPYNSIAEFLDALTKRRFRRRWLASHMRPIQRNPRPVLFWSVFGTLLAAVAVFGLPLMTYLSAPGIISSQIVNFFYGSGTGLALLLVLLGLFAETLLGKRYWCKSLCPVGAGLAIFRHHRSWSIHFDSALCDCKKDSAPCQYACPLALSPKHERLYPFCFNCGLCTASCMKTGHAALSLRFGEREF